MKKLLLSAVVVASLFTACKKDDDKKEPTGPTVPSSYTQKVVLEEFTGAWCGWCVDGHYKMETMTTDNAGKFIGVCVHYGDGMQISSYASFYDPTYNVSSFPSGMVNRAPDAGGNGTVMSRSYW